MVGIRGELEQVPRGQGRIAGAARLREHMHDAGVLEGPQLSAQVQVPGDVRGATGVHAVAGHATCTAQQDAQGRHGSELAAVVAVVAIAPQRRRERLRVVEQDATLGPQVYPRVVQPAAGITTLLERVLHTLPEALRVIPGRPGLAGDAAEHGGEGQGHELVVALDLCVASCAAVHGVHATPAP